MTRINRFVSSSNPTSKRTRFSSYISRQSLMTKPESVIYHRSLHDNLSASIDYTSTNDAILGVSMNKIIIIY